MTIEDETGTANLVLWKDRITAQQAIVVGSGVIAAHGRLQREGDMVHLVVRFVQPLLSHLGEERGREITISSRDLY